MASRGEMVAGTSGDDFVHRERVALHYQTSVRLKARLRAALTCHMLLLTLLGLKLLAAILDMLDIFILEVEELYIPQPRLWEWWYMSSGGAAWALARGAGRSAAGGVRRALWALGGTAGAALAAAAAASGPALWRLALDGARDEPATTHALVAAAFLLLCVQTHVVQVWTARRLLALWRARPR